MAVLTRTSRAGTLPLSLVAVAASVAMPFMVHLVPAGQSLGAALLPIFWAPFLAALMFGPVPAFFAALGAPVANHLLTGMPPTAVLPSLTLELVLFVAALSLLVRWSSLRKLPLLAPAAYLIARLVAAFILLGGAGLEGSLGSLGAALPGIVALAAINWLYLLLRKGSR